MGFRGPPRRAPHLPWARQASQWSSVSANSKGESGLARAETGGKRGAVERENRKQGLETGKGRTLREIAGGWVE